MMRILTDEEISRMGKDMDSWWSRLEMTTKHNIYMFLKDMTTSQDVTRSIEFQKDIDKERAAEQLELYKIEVKDISESKDVS